jgi:hypothetical protein
LKETDTKHVRVTLGASLLCAASSLLAGAPAEVAGTRGEWRLNNGISSDTVRLTLTYRSPGRSFGWSNSQPLADLHGLALEQLHAARTQVMFTMPRDAGTFLFEGSLILGVGGG